MKNSIQLLALSLICAAAVTACSAKSSEPSQITNAAEIEAPITDAKLLAVLSYAEWCNSCRVLDPKLEDARQVAEAKGVTFIKLDYTDKDDAAYYRHAERLGIGEAVRFYMDGNIKTGRLMIIRPGENRAMDFVTMNHSSEEILAKFDAALES